MRYFVEYTYREFGSRRKSYYGDYFTAETPRQAVVLAMRTDAEVVIKCVSVMDKYGCGRPVPESEWK